MDKKFIAWPDTHIPYQDKVAVEVALKILKWYQPHEVIILGDFMDCAPVSHWLKQNSRNRTKEKLRLADDFRGANHLLDRILGTKSIKKLVYLEGNHEDWINDAIERNPEFDGLINLDLGLKFEVRRAKHEIIHLPYGECYKLGKLRFTHGTYTGANHAYKHVSAYECSIVYGHLHDVQLATKVSPIDIEDKHIGLSLGCLADKNPQYLENKPNNWVHAIGVGMVRDDGTFNIDPVMISKGRASYAGRTFSWS